MQKRGGGAHAYGLNNANVENLTFAYVTNQISFWSAQFNYQLQISIAEKYCKKSITITIMINLHIFNISNACIYSLFKGIEGNWWARFNQLCYSSKNMQHSHRLKLLTIMFINNYVNFEIATQGFNLTQFAASLHWLANCDATPYKYTPDCVI